MEKSKVIEQESRIEQEAIALETLLKALKPILRPYTIPTDSDSRGHTEGVLLADFPPDGGDTRLVLVRDQLLWEKKGGIQQAVGSWEIKDFQELTPRGAVMRFSFVEIMQNLARSSS